jgi:hypothetical protein
VYYPVPSSNITVSPLDEPPKPVVQVPFGKPDPNADPTAPAKGINDSATAQDGEDWWKANAPEAAKGLIDATIKPGKPN